MAVAASPFLAVCDPPCWTLVLIVPRLLLTLAAAQRQTLEMLERIGGLQAQLANRFAQARLPDTLPVSLRLCRRALPSLLRDVLALAEEELGFWRLEAPAKRRFRTPRSHQIVHSALALATEQAEHATAATELSAGDVAAIEALRAHEAELAQAAREANAALAAEDYDEAV